MLVRKPWNPLQELLSDANAAAGLQPVAPIRLPADTPPQVAQQIWNNVMQQALQKCECRGYSVSMPMAVCESVRIASEFRSEGKLSGSFRQH